MPDLSLTRDAVLLLKRVLGNPSKISEVANNSYTHPLGFEKYVIATLPTGEALRLHYWPANYKHTDEDIHSHCASFESTVLIGKMRSEIFDLMHGDEFNLYSYSFNALTNQSEAQKLGVTGIKFKESISLSKGDKYKLAAHVLHRVTEISPGTLTLSTWGARDSNALVVKRKNSSSSECCRTAGLPIKFVIERFSTILSGLEDDIKCARN